MNNLYKEESKVKSNPIIYVVMLLYFMVMLSAGIMAWVGYVPYSFFSSTPSYEAQRLMWGLMIVPSVMVAVALLLSNILNKKLCNATLLLVEFSCGFFALVCYIMKLGNPVTISYITSSVTFCLCAMNVCAIVYDLRGQQRIRQKWIRLSIGVVILAAMGYISYLVIRIIVIANFFPMLVICFIMPAVCFIFMVSSAINAFAGCFSKLTIQLLCIVSAFGTLCAAYGELNHRVCHLILAAGITVTAFMMFYELMLDLFNKEEKSKNDSKSCDA